MPLKLTSDPIENERKLSKIAQDARQANAGGGLGSLESNWAQNLKHLSGLLLDATRETLTTISGGYRHTLQERAKLSGEPVALNLILPRASRFLARHMNLMGGVRATAATDDPADSSQAKAAERLMQAMWDNKGLDIATMKALIFMLGCYRGYVMIEGDPKAKYRHEKDGNGLWQAYEQGDVVYKSFIAAQVAAYPGIEEINDSDAIVVTDFLTGEYLKRRWNITPPDEAEVGSYGITALDALVPELDKVTYKTKRLFIKPSVTRPLGEHHVIIGEKLMFSSKTPDGRKTIDTYDFKYPLVEFADAPISFGYAGYGRQTAARTVVKILCATWSRMVQCSVGIPGIWVDIPENSEISQEKLTNASYQVIYRNPNGGPVGFHSIPSMPHHEAMINLCIRWLDEIYVQSPPSRGMSPGSRFAAKGLQFLAQQDVLADTPTGKMVLKGMHSLFRRGLGEGLRVWPDKQVEDILGEGREIEKVALEKGRLEQGWDIFVLPGSGSVQSTESQRRDINESFQLGLLRPEEARRLAGYYVKEEVFEPKRAQSRIVAMEEEAFGVGEDVDINPYDDHELHIRDHDKTAARRYGKAEGMEEWRRQRHTVKHKGALNLQAQATVADQQAAEMEAKMMGGEEPPSEEAPQPEPGPMGAPEEMGEM